MDVYKTRQFSRWARKHDMRDKSLCRAAQEMALGLYEADLGGNLFKKRISRSGQGKSGGFRTFVAAKRGSTYFFIYGFAKNVRSNIDKAEEEALKKLASTLLKLALPALTRALRAEEVIEVFCDG